MLRWLWIVSLPSWHWGDSMGCEGVSASRSWASSMLHCRTHGFDGTPWGGPKKTCSMR